MGESGVMAGVMAREEAASNARDVLRLVGVNNPRGDDRLAFNDLPPFDLKAARRKNTGRCRSRFPLEGG